MSRGSPSSVALRFGDRVYQVRADMRLVAGIEDELGGIDDLLFRFSNGLWKVTDLVSVVHMMLAACGKSVDYMALGDQMIEDGLDEYLTQARRFLQRVVMPRRAAS